MPGIIEGVEFPGITQGEAHLWEWRHESGGSFMRTIFRAIGRADPENRAKLAKAFPEEVEAFMKFNTVPGYMDELDGRIAEFEREERVAREGRAAMLDHHGLGEGE